MSPCPAVARAILGAVDAPDGVLLRCGLVAEHEGLHRYLMEWSDPAPGGDGPIADEIQWHLMERSGDPEFRRRLAERIEKDAKILRRLAEDDGPAPGFRQRMERAMRPRRLRGTERPW